MLEKHAIKKILLLLLLILMAAPVIRAYAQRDHLESKESIIIYDDGLRAVAEKTAGIYPDLKAELEEMMGWDIDFKPVIVLIKDNSTFQKMSGSCLIVAYALPDQGVIVVDYSRMMTDPFTLEATIKHELCHLLLHNKIGSERLPRWLDEGVAQWASGGLADIVMEKRSILSEAFRQNRLIGLKYLSGGFPDDGSMLMLAYAESKGFTEYMAKTGGARGILSLLNLLKDGEDIDSAIIKTFSVSFQELERGWHEDMEKSAIWIAILINNLYEVLFSLAALALVYGFFRAWRKKRQYGEEDGEAEVKKIRR